MNLTWHIVRKDLRRMAWPVLAWLGFLVASAMGVVLVECQLERVTPGAAAEWMRGLRSASIGVSLIGTSALVLLAGVLVLEDRVAGTQSFWLTRPIAGGRLLRAKLIAAGGLLVVAPIVVHLPVWLVAGFDGRELVRVAWHLGLVNAGVVVVAMALAALTENLGQQAFAVLTTMGLSVLAIEVVPAVFDRTEATRVAIGTQAWVILGIFVVGAGAALSWQYRTRQTLAGWMIWLAAVVGVVGVRVGWTWDCGRAGGPPAMSAEGGQIAVALTADGDLGELRPGAAIQAVVAPPTKGPPWVAPWQGRGVLRDLEGGSAEVEFGLSEGWGFEVARLLTGVKRADSSLPWELAVSRRPQWERRAASRSLIFSGTMEFVHLEGEVWYEVPVQAGAIGQRGATRTRVLGVAEGAKETLLVEERRAARAFPIVQTSPLEVDRYVLVQRSTGALCRVRALGQRGVGSGGMLVDILMLTAEPAVDLRREGWTLIKVRLAARERWVQEFRDLPVAKAGSPEKGGQ